MARARPSSPADPLDRILGDAPALQALRAQIRHLARFDALGSAAVPTVLLQGETGTGKGLVARVIHDSGPRASGPFIAVNGAAIPETLLEAELFGVEAGAFTDAKHAKPGLFEAASGGTLFLDEIDALPFALQGKCLTAIEDKRLRRVGAVVERPVDIKLIAATQVALNRQVQAGHFRADLYHRLAVVVLALPPLRERGDDIVVLARTLLQQYGTAYGVGPQRLSQAAEAWLVGQPWPGNVRELSHLLERVALLETAMLIGPASLERLCLAPPPPEASAVSLEASSPGEPRPEAERLAEALRQSGGNLAAAARLLGMSRGGLRHRLHRYQMTQTPPQPPAHVEQEAGEGEPARPSSPAAPTLGSDGREEQAVLSSSLVEEGQGEQVSRRPDERPASLRRGSSVELAAGWVPKPVAVLAIAATWPEPSETAARPFEPWTVASHWEQLVAEKVAGFGGVILQGSTSLLLAAFGLPQTLEQLPQRAMQAALAIRRAADEVSALADAMDGPVVRLAGHLGTLLVAQEAGDAPSRWLALGETLALPVRLLGHAAPGEMLVSPEMGALVEGWCDVQARQVALQGGQSGPHGEYTLVGTRPRGSRLAMPGRRPLSPFVGRKQALATLCDRVGQVAEGYGQLVGVIGDPGVGKSRLCHEFVRGTLGPPWVTMEGWGNAYDRDTPYQPIIDLLTHYFRLDDWADRPTIRDRVTAQLCLLDPSFVPTLAAFLTLFDVPVDDPLWQALEAPQRRRRTLDAVTRLLIRESQRQPLLLVIENLHWIDRETQALLDCLVDSLPTARVLLLVTYRPEYQHGWGGKSYYSQLRLDPLPRESAYVFLDALLGDDATLDPLKSHLHERTQGNPFFLEESVRALAETQTLVGTPGAYRLAQSPPRLQVPSSVQAVLAARIDRLPAAEKHILQAAAVIGREVPWALLRAIAEVPEEGLRLSLTHLQGAEFLYETSLFPDVVYTFTHALTHEVAYGSLIHARRRALHARIVEAIEVLYPEHLVGQVDRLAYHAYRGEVWDKTLCYGHQAGEKAWSRGAYREAMTSFEQALEALDHLPEHPDAGLLGIELRRRIGSVLSLVGEHQRSLTLLGEAEARARQRDDRARLGQVLARVVSVRRIVGDFEGALAAGREALALAARLGDHALHVHLAYRLGQLYASRGDYGRAAAVLRGNVETLARGAHGHTRDWCIASQAWLAEVLGLRGAFVEGRRHGEEALRLVMGDGPWYGDAPIAVRARLGALYGTQGDLPAAIWVFEEGLALCRASDDKAVLGRMLGGLGEAYAHTGRVAEGLALLEEAHRHDRYTGAVGGGYVTRLRQLSAVYLLAGCVDAARQHACQALDLARQQQARGDEAQALFQLGAVQAHASPPHVQQAESDYRQALDLAQELGMRPLMAHCHRGLGALYAQIGQQEQARAELTTAIDLYRAMEMTFWLPQAEAALAHIG
jgi:DNA-binding NtrC family response regulator/tetratricopeptide (TPR) repeat protein